MANKTSEHPTLTHVVGRVEYKPDIARPGDLVIYAQKPYALSRKVRKYYGLVTFVANDMIWIISACTSDNEGEKPQEFGIPAEHSDRIIEIVRNGEVHRK